MLQKIKSKVYQNEVSAGLFKNSDLDNRIDEIVSDFSSRSGFVPEQLLRKSSWWGSTEIGAFHYSGKFKGQKAVLKIQGVKPSTSEIFMIQSFAKSNRSKIIRPPQLFDYQLWDDHKRYEALILEDVGEKRIVNSPTNTKEVANFYKLHAEYRSRCLSEPWIAKPEQSISNLATTRFAKWREASLKIYPHHPYRSADDMHLVEVSLKRLVSGYTNIQPEFVHGHFSAGDLYTVNQQTVLLSNLYWSWRPPFWDTIFAYHWHIYSLASIPNITPKQIEKQRSLWFNHINKLSHSLPSSQKEQLLLALLERATAGLLLDALSCDPNLPASKYLVEKTRSLLNQYLKELA